MASAFLFMFAGQAAVQGAAGVNNGAGNYSCNDHGGPIHDAENCLGKEITIDCPSCGLVALPDIVTVTFVDILISTVTGEVIGPAAIGDPVLGGGDPDLRFGPVDDPAVAIELAEAEAEAEAEAAAQLKTEQERLCRAAVYRLR